MSCGVWKAVCDELKNYVNCPEKVVDCKRTQADFERESKQNLLRLEGRVFFRCCSAFKTIAFIIHDK